MDVKPTLNRAYIENNDDALKVVECVLNGDLHSVSRRPYEIERPKLICSGNIFVFIEEKSGIKRWTDGIPWSPSRVVGKFLVYKELFRSNSGGGGGSAKQQSRDSTNYSNTGSTGDAGIAGTATYSYRSDGLIKKAFSLRVKSNVDELDPTQDPRDRHLFTIHIISYYTLDDITNGVLVTPSEMVRFQKVVPSQRLLDALEHTSIGNFKTIGSVKSKKKKKPYHQHQQHEYEVQVPGLAAPSIPSFKQMPQHMPQQVPSQMFVPPQRIIQPSIFPPPPPGPPGQSPAFPPYYQQMYQQGTQAQLPQYPYNYTSVYHQEMYPKVSADPGISHNSNTLNKLPFTHHLPPLSLPQQPISRSLPPISATQPPQLRQLQQHTTDKTSNVSPTQPMAYLPVPPPPPPLSASSNVTTPGGSFTNNMIMNMNFNPMYSGRAAGGGRGSITSQSGQSMNPGGSTSSSSLNLSPVSNSIGSDSSKSSLTGTAIDPTTAGNTTTTNLTPAFKVG